MGLRIGLWAPIMLVMATAVQAAHMDYFDFNVVSLGDIGTPSKNYKGSIEGRAVSLGSAWFRGVSLHGQYSGPETPYSFYSGGDLGLTGGIHNGGIEAAGSVTIQGGRVAGPLVAGGSLLGNGGSIAGDVTLTGQNLAGHGLSIAGVLAEGVPYTPTLDLQELGQFFLDNSATIGAMPDTLTPVVNGSQIILNGVSGENVFTLPASQLLSATSLTIDAPADAVVYINLVGTAITLDGINVAYSGGISGRRVLANMPQATSLDLRGDHALNLLAPHAETYFSSGVLHGNLIVGGLNGKGSVSQQGGFSSSIPVLTPEPASLLIMLIPAALLIHSRRRIPRESEPGQLL